AGDHASRTRTDLTHTDTRPPERPGPRPCSGTCQATTGRTFLRTQAFQRLVGTLRLRATMRAELEPT
ncbi:hypothetical protein, partial [Streptomyces hygroscopicus]|uniref:hypothetical protein n=1 Tax=Streptomyces hygroscopicus TaxID=1912 RepID=UPI0025563E2E